MKALVYFVAGLIFFLSACAPRAFNFGWRVRELARAPGPDIALVDPSNKVLATVSTLTMRKFLLAHLRVTRVAGIHAALLLVDGNDPNAFADDPGARPIIAVNLALLELLENDEHEFAALIGHEAAHLARGHGASARTRTSTLNAIGAAVGMGMAAAGVPASGVISGLAVDLVDTAYNREQEREADALGVQYAIKAGYDPAGALRLQEKLLKSGRAPIPFLSSHPSGEERIKNLKAIIAAAQAPAEQGQASMAGDHRQSGAIAASVNE
ncbi:MAG TPA: M48 family metalloprotease [Candidatus Acidoferrales bacterium]|nr:M48 family metalloprotease [Candidatus Acidoferrales bacterium]